ncbi:DnaD domain protein [Virgibacillus halophilus]|uniref:DnaD domain protein n=1 Tax=Tigheibacillus halophilus TaxID=361280 RepID=UPI00362EFADF
MGESLVLEALKRTLDYNKSSWSYKKILANWKRKGIIQVEQAQKESSVKNFSALLAKLPVEVNALCQIETRGRMQQGKWSAAKRKKKLQNRSMFRRKKKRC